jgi:hypothetical protein
MPNQELCEMFIAMELAFLCDLMKQFFPKDVLGRSLRNDFAFSAYFEAVKS